MHYGNIHYWKYYISYIDFTIIEAHFESAQDKQSHLFIIEQYCLKVPISTIHLLIIKICFYVLLSLFIINVLYDAVVCHTIFGLDLGRGLKVMQSCRSYHTLTWGLSETFSLSIHVQQLQPVMGRSSKKWS